MSEFAPAWLSAGGTPPLNYLKDLKKLSIRQTEVSEKGLEYLAKSSNLPSLEYIDITCNNVKGHFDSVGYDAMNWEPVWDGYRLEPLGKRMLEIAKEAGNEIKWANPIERFKGIDPIDDLF